MLHNNKSVATVNTWKWELCIPKWRWCLPWMIYIQLCAPSILTSRSTELCSRFCPLSLTDPPVAASAWNGSSSPWNLFNSSFSYSFSFNTTWTWKGEDLNTLAQALALWWKTFPGKEVDVIMGVGCLLEAEWVCHGWVFGQDGAWVRSHVNEGSLHWEVLWVLKDSVGLSNYTKDFCLSFVIRDLLWLITACIVLPMPSRKGLGSLYHRLRNFPSVSCMLRLSSTHVPNFSSGSFDYELDCSCEQPFFHS